MITRSGITPIASTLAAVPVSLALSTASFAVDPITSNMPQADQVRAVAELCLTSNGSLEKARSFFDKSGFDSAEWGGLIEYDLEGLYVYYSDDFFCDISSDVSQASAQLIVITLLEDLGISWKQATKDITVDFFGNECWTVDTPETRIVVNSTGQDPGCFETGDSAIRIWFGGDT